MKEYVNICLGPNFTSPKWKCPFNRLRCFNEEVLLYNILFMSPVKNQYL